MSSKLRTLARTSNILSLQGSFHRTEGEYANYERRKKILPSAGFEVSYDSVVIKRKEISLTAPYDIHVERTFWPIMHPTLPL
jgi:hypothetical protein